MFALYIVEREQIQLCFQRQSLLVMMHFTIVPFIADTDGKLTKRFKIITVFILSGDFLNLLMLIR